MARPHYPRMMYHRTKPPVTVHSWAEEYALGAEWRRTVWPVALGGGSPATVPPPEPPAASAVPEPDAASGDGDPPDAPHPIWQGPEKYESGTGEAIRPKRPQLTYNKLPSHLADAAAEAKSGTGELPPKRQRAPTVKPTGKPKKKSRDW